MLKSELAKSYLKRPGVCAPVPRVVKKREVPCREHRQFLTSSEELASILSSSPSMDDDASGPYSSSVLPPLNVPIRSQNPEPPPLHVFFNTATTSSSASTLEPSCWKYVHISY